MDVCCALETATKILLWTAKHNTGGFRLSSRMTMCYDKQKSRCCARIEWQCLRLVIDDKNRLLEQNSDEGQPIISHLVSGGLAMNDDGSLHISDYEKREFRRYEHRYVFADTDLSVKLRLGFG